MYLWQYHGKMQYYNACCQSNQETNRHSAVIFRHCKVNHEDVLAQLVEYHNLDITTVLPT